MFLPGSAAAWLSSEVSSLPLIVYFPFHLGICLKDGKRKKEDSWRTLLIMGLFEAAANEAPGTFIPGAHGPASPGSCFPVLWPPKNRHSPPRIQAQTGGIGLEQFSGLRIPPPPWTPWTARDAMVMMGGGTF